MQNTDVFASVFTTFESAKEYAKKEAATFANVDPESIESDGWYMHDMDFEYFQVEITQTTLQD